MSHFHVRRWQGGVGTSAFSLFLQRFILITITYVIRIESKEEASRFLPLLSHSSFRGGGKAHCQMEKPSSPAIVGRPTAGH